MKAKMIYTCLFLMAMFTAINVRGQTTNATAYSFDYDLLYPAPNDSRLTGSVAPHVLFEPKTGKIAYGVRTDSTELDSLTSGYQRAWSLEVRRIVSNTANGYSDSVEFRKRETGHQGAVTYKDTTIFIYQNKTLLTDVWPGIDIMFYDGDSMDVRDVMLVYLVNREFIKTQGGNIITLPMDRYDTLTVADDDTLYGLTDTIFTRAFPITRHVDVGAFIDIRPISGTGDTLTLAVQTKLNGSGWYGGSGRSGRIIKSPVAFFDSTYNLIIPADSIGQADSARVAQIAETNKGRNIIKRFMVKFWK